MTNLQIALIRYRENHNLNQSELANLIGCTRNAIANWETGRSTPKAEAYSQIAQKLNVDVKYLLGETNNPNPITTSAKEQLSGVKLALYDQTKELTEEQAQDVLNYLEYVKNKKTPN